MEHARPLLRPPKQHCSWQQREVRSWSDHQMRHHARTPHRTPVELTHSLADYSCEARRRSRVHSRGRSRGATREPHARHSICNASWPLPRRELTYQIAPCEESTKSSLSLRMSAPNFKRNVGTEETELLDVMDLSQARSPMPPPHTRRTLFRWRKKQLLLRFFEVELGAETTV
jgi:hypothetical protein